MLAARSTGTASRAALSLSSRRPWKRRGRSTGMSLSRYIEAQNDPDAGYAVALHEIRTTGKRSHWVWYVFPNLGGLGSSANAQNFALRDLEEAIAFMHHPVLGDRLQEICDAIVGRLNSGSDLITLMGSRIDVLKLVSCMTLFAGLAQQECRLSQESSAILNAARGEGFPPCDFTAARLTNPPPPAC